MRTPDGPATLHIRRDADGVSGTAWGPGSDWVLERLPGWIGAEDDPRTFRPDPGPVAEMHRRRIGHRFAKTGLVVDALMSAVVGQKVAGKEAKRVLRGLLDRFSATAPGPVEGLTLPPDPLRLADAPYHLFHDLGIERRRAETLRRVGRESGRIQAAAELGSEQVREVLEAVPGIGEWTSAETVVVSHGDPDVVSVGDYHLKHQVCWHLAGEHRGTDPRMLELLDPYRPHRGRVVRLLESAGRYPRYGPRRALRSFERS